MRELVFLPTAYEPLIRQSKRMPLDTAVALLSSKAHRNITRAIRYPNDEVTLVRHIWKCPYCGHELPAYWHSLKKLYHLDEPKAVYDEQKLSEWGSRQTSLFETPSVFQSNTPIDLPRGTAQCPRCYRLVSDHSDYRLVEVAEKDHRLILTTALHEEESQEIMVNADTLKQTPLLEIITFDLNAHTVVCTYSDGSPQQPEELPIEYATTTACLVDHYHLLSRRLKRFLKRYWPDRPLPFSVQEQKWETFLLMARFTGWRRSFYDALPLVGTSLNVDSSFLSVLNCLKSSAKVTTYTHTFEFLKMPALRCLILLENQGFLVYLPECAFLWELLEEDENLFSRLIRERYAIFDILSWLHRSQPAQDFLSAFSSMQGKQRLFTLLKRCLYHLQLYTAWFGTLSSEEAAKAQKDWSDTDFLVSIPSYCPSRYWEFNEVSTPFIPIQSVPADCLIDGYFFHRISSRREAAVADKQMHQFFRKRITVAPPMFAVYQNHELMGTFSVHRATVIDIWGPDGGEAVDPYFWFAFENWLQRFHLTYEPNGMPSEKPRIQ